MVRGNLSINSQGYFLTPGSTVRQEDQDVFATAFRTTGQQRSGDVQTVSKRTFLPPLRGFGRDRIPSHLADDGEQYRRAWDMIADLWEDGARLPILEEDSTETSLGVLRAMTRFKGDLWSLWEDTDTSAEIVARKYDGANTQWTGGGQVSASDADDDVAVDIIAHKTHLIALYIGDDGSTGGSNDFIVKRSTDGASWSSPAVDFGTDLLSDAMSGHEDINAGFLVELGGEVVAVVWDEANGTVTFFSSADAGNNWTDEGVDITASGGVLGAAVYADTDDTDKIYVLVNDGLFAVDTSPATWTITKIATIAQTRDLYGGNRLVVHSNKLWIALGVSNDEAAAAWTMEVSGSTRIWDTEMGLNVGDGVPSDMLGPITEFFSAGPFLYASVGGGAASRQARILRHNSLGWNHVRQNGSANQKIETLHISSNDDDVPRLHYGLRTASGTTDSKFLAYPQTNPNSGVSIKRESTGYIDFPWFDNGMPHDDAAFLRHRTNALDLSATTSGEYINVDDAIDGEARAANDRGDILSGTSQLAIASGAGVSSKAMAVRVNLNRDGGDNTQTPVLLAHDVEFLKQVSVPQRWTVEVDIDRTARETAGGDRETVMSNLETARDSVVLVPFTYGNTGTHYVKVRIPEWEQSLTEPGLQGLSAGSNSLVRRSGRVTIVLEEAVGS